MRTGTPQVPVSRAEGAREEDRRRGGSVIFPFPPVPARIPSPVQESKSAIISQIITSTIEEGLIKPDEKAGLSRRFARYLPFWA